MPRQKTLCYLGELKSWAQSRGLKTVEGFKEQGEAQQVKLRRAVARRDGDDLGLDCRALADGVPADAGQLPETMKPLLPIAGTDPFCVRRQDGKILDQKHGRPRSENHG